MSSFTRPTTTLMDHSTTQTPSSKGVAKVHARLDAHQAAREVERRVWINDLVISKITNGVTNPSDTFHSVEIEFGVPAQKCKRFHVLGQVKAIHATTITSGSSTISDDSVWSCDIEDVSAGRITVTVPIRIVFASLPAQVQHAVSVAQTNRGDHISTAAAMMNAPEVIASLPTIDSYLEIRGALQYCCYTNKRRLMVTQFHHVRTIPGSSTRAPQDITSQVKAFETQIAALYHEHYLRGLSPAQTPSHPPQTPRTPSSRSARNVTSPYPPSIVPTRRLSPSKLLPAAASMCPSSSKGLPAKSLPLPSLFDEFTASQEDAHMAMADQVANQFTVQQQQRQLQAQMPPLPNAPLHQRPPQPMSMPTGGWNRTNTPAQPHRPSFSNVNTPAAATAHTPMATATSSKPRAAPGTFVPPRPFTPAKPAGATPTITASTSASAIPAMVGFQTGSGRNVATSAAALEAASKRIAQWQTEDPADTTADDDSLLTPANSSNPVDPSRSSPGSMDERALEMPMFTTGSGRQVTITPAAEARAKKMMAEVDQTLANENRTTSPSVQSPAPNEMMGFSTGRGKSMPISAASLAKANQMFQKWHETEGDDKLDASDGFGLSDHDRPPSPSCRPDFDPNSFQPSFSTGRGKKVETSAAAKAKAEKMMAEVVAEMEKTMPTPTRSVAQATTPPAAATSSIAPPSMGGFSSAKPFRPPASTRSPPTRIPSATASNANPPAVQHPSVVARKSKLDLLDAQIEAYEHGTAQIEDDGFDAKVEEAPKSPAVMRPTIQAAATIPVVPPANPVAAAPIPIPVPMDPAKAAQLQQLAAQMAALGGWDPSAILQTLMQQQPPAPLAIPTAPMIHASVPVPSTLPVPAAAPPAPATSIAESGASISGQKRKALSQVVEETSQEVDSERQHNWRTGNKAFTPSANVRAPMSSPPSASMPPLATPSPSSIPTPPTASLPPPSPEQTNKRQRLETTPAPSTSPVGATSPPISHTPIPIASFDAVSPSDPLLTTPTKGGYSQELCIPATPSLEPNESPCASLEAQFDKEADDPMQTDIDIIKQHQLNEKKRLDQPMEEDLPPSSPIPQHRRLAEEIRTFASPI